MNSSGYNLENLHNGNTIVEGNLSVSGDLVADDVVFDDIKLSGNLDANGNNILNCNNLQATTFNGGVPITNPLSSNLDMNSNIIQNCTQVQNSVGTLTLLSLGNQLYSAPQISLNANIITNATETRINQELKMNNNNITGVNEIDTDILNSNATALITCNTDLAMSNNSITGALNITTNNLNGNADLNITAVQLTQSTTANRLFQDYIQMGTLLSIDTVHVFEASTLSLGNITTIGGFDYYNLSPNTQYIFHGSIELIDTGFLLGVNNSLRGSTSASEITFTETTKNIIGFKCQFNNCYISDLTISGGGGHFDNTAVGLFDCLNYSILSPPPFYQRDKICRIINCNIQAPYSLGKILGFSTINFNNNFINGGGSIPSGTYTREGLTVSDGLSFEFNNNKVVLFAGAQTTSTTYMLRLIQSDPLLQFNAVNVSGNIMHPRNQERAILFEEDSKTELGLIASNTFIRTGGTAPLIDYPYNTIFKNYNCKEVVNYEIVANAGVINGEVILQASTGLHNSITSATYIDLDIPITSINPITKSKRFSLLFTLLGTTGIGYTVGNLLVSVTDTTKRGYITNIEPIAAGVQLIYITDMTGIFPDLLNYKEQDLNLVDTGITSTSMQIGSNTNNLEFKMIDKDPVDLQFSIMITYQNNGSDDEVQFRMLRNDNSGTGYVPLNQSEISHTISRANRVDTAIITFIERIDPNDLIKIEYRYVDATTSTIQTLTYSAK